MKIGKNGPRRGQAQSSSDPADLQARRRVVAHDRVRQRVDAQQVFVTDDGIRLYPVHIRYAWPSELDLMARLAGLDYLLGSDGTLTGPRAIASRVGRGTPAGTMYRWLWVHGDENGDGRTRPREGSTAPV